MGSGECTKSRTVRIGQFKHKLCYFSSLDLKPLPDSLMYSFLGPDESLYIIIASYLDQDQEEILIDLHRENKEAIG